MSESVVIRPATAGEAPAVAGVWERAWHDGHRGHVPDALVAGRGPAYFAARAAALVDQTLVAVDVADGSLLGVVITQDDEVQQLMVEAAARGRGIGGLLLDAAERLIAAAGAAEAWLAVVPGNVSARRFYERRGWSDRGLETYQSVTLDGGTVPVPVCRYTRPLG